jgi:hypothetical protein
MQYSDVNGGKNDADKVLRIRGTLLIRNERRIVRVCPRSLCSFALAKMSKDARIRSMVIDCTSP